MPFGSNIIQGGQGGSSSSISSSSSSSTSSSAPSNASSSSYVSPSSHSVDISASNDSSSLGAASSSSDVEAEKQRADALAVQVALQKDDIAKLQREIAELREKESGAASVNATLESKLKEVEAMASSASLSSGRGSSGATVKEICKGRTGSSVVLCAISREGAFLHAKETKTGSASRSARVCVAEGQGAQWQLVVDLEYVHSPSLGLCS